jgi:hypothetical protein
MSKQQMMEKSSLTLEQIRNHQKYRRRACRTTNVNEALEKFDQPKPGVGHVIGFVNLNGDDSASSDEAPKRNKDETPKRNKRKKGKKKNTKNDGQDFVAVISSDDYLDALIDLLQEAVALGIDGNVDHVYDSRTSLLMIGFYSQCQPILSACLGRGDDGRVCSGSTFDDRCIEPVFVHATQKYFPPLTV